MSVVKINAVSVPLDQAEGFAQRFAARRGTVESAPGFEQFLLLQPSDGSTEWMVVTVWASEDAFTAWTASNDFRAAHRQAAEKAGAAAGTADAGTAAAPSKAGPPRGGITARLLSFDVLEHVRAAAPLT